MDVSGSQKIKAPREQVFNALLNPEVLKNSIPSCDSAEFVDFPTGRQLKLTVSPSLPGFKGPYVIYMSTGEVVPPSRVVLMAEPSTNNSHVKATCVIDLADDGSNTNLNYNAHADLEGKIASAPDIVLKPAIKVALDQFFKNFEKQVSSVAA